MLKKILTLALASFLIFSCDDEKDAIPVQYFQVTVDASYSTDSSDDWLVLQDENGNLLSAKPFESGGVITFDTTAVIDSDIALTIFSYKPAPNNFYNVTSYMGLSPGETLTLKNSIPSYETGPPQGKLSVTINGNDLGHLFNAALSTKMREEIPSANSSTTTNFVFSQREIEGNVNDFFLFVADKNRVPKYKFIENASVGNLNFSLSDLNSFDKTITLTVPPSSSQSYAMVQAYESDQALYSAHGYRINFYLEGLVSFLPANTFTLGYLNRFTRYYTHAGAYYPGHSLTYVSLGAAPTQNINLSKADVNISNNTFSGFAVSGSDYDWRSTRFTYTSSSGGSIYWRINSDKSHLKNLALPQVFLNKFPAFKGDLVKHQTTEFTKGTSYENYILGPLRGDGPLRSDMPLESFTNITTTIN